MPKIVSHTRIQTGTGEVRPDFPNAFFNQILAFLGYGFCKSHALSYSMYSAVELWLKAYYPLEFMCANLTVTPRAREKKDVPILDQRVRYCQSKGFKIYPPSVNSATNRWTIHNHGLMAPLTNIKGFGEGDFQKIKETRPYSSFSDFCERSGLGKSKVEILILSGALDEFGEREYLYNWFEEVFLAKPKKKKKAQIDFFEDEEMEEQFEIKHTFSKSDLELAFADLNGFSIMENLVRKYAKLLEERKEVKTIGELNSRKTAKHILILCKIVGKESFTSKMGNKFVKMTFSDGCDSAETVVQETNWKRFSKTLKPGNILILPVQLSDNGGFYLEDLDKKNAQVLETE